MHLDEDQLERLLHRELSGSAEASAREHLAACPTCRQRVAQAERDEEEVFTLLHHVDHPAPVIDARAIVARARAPSRGWIRWAAGVILALGVAATAYAAPGSPVPAWVRAIAAWMAGRSPARASDRENSAAGIALVPGRHLVIVFTSFQAEGRAQVTLSDGAELVVRAPSRGGAATFTTDADRLVVDNQGSTANFEIQIPRAAPRVEIWVNGVRMFVKDGPRVSGPSLLPLTSGAP